MESDAPLSHSRPRSCVSGVVETAKAMGSGSAAPSLYSVAPPPTSPTPSDCDADHRGAPLRRWRRRVGVLQLSRSAG